MSPRKRRSKAKAIQTSANALRAHRDAQNYVHLNDSIAGCRDSCANDAAPHPIHSLPPETLSQIFIFTLDIDSAAAAELFELSRHSERHLQIFNPLVLCAVCSSWRSLAFATPQLWQSVYIHIPFILKKSLAEKRAADLVQWIERSRSLSLSLHISWDYHSDGPNDAQPIVSVLNNNAIRWETVYLRDRHAALQLRPSPMTRSTLFPADKRHRSLFQIFSLSYLYDTPIPFSWAEITHLQLPDQIPYGSNRESIFMKSPKLVQLSMFVPSSSQPFGGSVIHHNLVTLSIRMSCGFGHLFNYLSLPSLRDMFINQVSSKDIQPLLNCFTRSSCSLVKLEVHGLNLSPDDLLNVLSHRSCNSLTSLKILESCDFVQGEAFVDDGILRRLALHQDNPLCPHLKFLTIDCGIECSLSVLLKLVESRVGGLTDWQPPDEPIQYLRFRSIKRLNDVRKLDEVGKGSGMEYTRRRHHVDHSGQYFYSILFQKQGLQRTRLLVNHGDFFFDQV